MKRFMKSPITLLLVLCLVLCTVGTAVAQLQTEQGTCLTRVSHEITPWGSIWYGGPDDDNCYVTLKDPMLYVLCFSCTREALERMTVSVVVSKDEVEELKHIMDHIYDSIRSKNN